MRNSDFFCYHVKYRERKRFMFEEDAEFHFETDDSDDGLTMMNKTILKWKA